MTKISMNLLGTVVLALITSPAFAQERSREERAPRVQRALQSLEAAKSHLGNASNQTDRQREALNDVERHLSRAIEQTERALQAVKAERSIDRGSASRNDLPLRAAQDALSNAREQLQQADGDFEGHREKAIEHIDAALERMDGLVQQERRQDRREDRESRRESREERRDSRDDDSLRGTDTSGLPRAVRRTVREQVPDLEVTEIKRVDDGNRTAYRIEGFSDQDGKVEMRVAEDGTLLSLDRKESKDRSERRRDDRIR